MASFSRILTISLISALSLTTGCGDKGVDDEVRSSLGKADTYYKAGLFKEALQHYQEAAAKIPTNATVHLFIGLSNEGLGLKTDALAAYEEAIKLGPSLQRPYRQKALLLLGEAKTQDVQAMLEEVESKPGMEGLAAFLRGEVARSKGDFEGAVKEYEEANRRTPGARDTVDALADAYVRLNRIDEAAALLEDFQNRGAADPGTSIQLAGLYDQKDDRTRAIEILRKAVEQFPAFAGAHSALANLLLEDGNTEEAGQEVQKAMAIDAGDAVALYVSGRVALRAGNSQQAVKDLEAALQRRPGDPTFRRVLREAQIAAGEVVEKVRSAQDKLAAQGKSTATLLELAEAYVYEGEGEDALRTTEQVLALEPENAQAHLVEALAHLSLGRLIPSQAAMDRAAASTDPRLAALSAFMNKQTDPLVAAVGALKAQPSTSMWGDYFEALGRLFAGNAGESLKILNEVSERDESFSLARYEMARIYENLNEHHLALALYQQISTTYPEREKPKILAARTLIRLGKPERAEVVLDGILQTNPASKSATFLLGSIHLQEHKFAEASKAFQALVDSETQSEIAKLFYRSALAKTFVFAQDYGRALAEYDAILSSHPNQSAAYVEKCLALLAQKKTDEALAAADAGLAIATDTSDLKLTRVVILQMMGRAEEGLPLLDEVESSVPPESPIRTRIAPLRALALGSVGRTDEAIPVITQAGLTAVLTRYYTETLEAMKAGEIELRQISLGLLCAFYQWPDVAREIYQSLAERYPKNKLVIAYLGESLVAARRTSKAIEAFSLGIAADSKDPYFLERRGAIYSRIDDYEKAVSDFSAVLVMNPKNPNLHFQLGQLYAEQGLKEDAVASYENVLNLTEDKRHIAGATNNLAWLLAGDEATRTKALEYAQKAFDTAEPNPRTGLKDGNIMDTIGWVHFLSGNLKEAQEMVQLALAQLPNHPTINYHLGRIYEAMGESKGAIIQYGKAVDFDPEFEEADDAMVRATRLNTALVEN